MNRNLLGILILISVTSSGGQWLQREQEQPYMKAYSYRQRLPQTASPPPLPPYRLLHSLTPSPSFHYSKSSFPLPKYSSERRPSDDGMRSSSSFDSLSATRAILSDPLLPVFQPFSPFTTLRLPHHRPPIMPHQLLHPQQSSESRKYSPWSPRNLSPVRRMLDRRYHRSPGSRAESNGDWFEAHIPLMTSPSTSSSKSKFISRSENHNRRFPALQLRQQRYPSSEPEQNSAPSFNSHFKAPDFRDSGSINIPPPPPEEKPENPENPATDRDEWNEGSRGTGPQASHNSVSGPPLPPIPSSTREEDKWSGPKSGTGPTPTSHHMNRDQYVTEIPSRPGSSASSPWNRAPAADGWHHETHSHLSSHSPSDPDRASSAYTSYGTDQKIPPAARFTGTTSWSAGTGTTIGDGARRSSGNEDGYHPVAAYQQSHPDKNSYPPSSFQHTSRAKGPHSFQTSNKQRAATVNIYHNLPSDANMNPGPGSSLSVEYRPQRVDADRESRRPASSLPAQSSQPSVSSIQDILNVVRKD